MENEQQAQIMAALLMGAMGRRHLIKPEYLASLLDAWESVINTMLDSPFALTQMYGAALTGQTSPEAVKIHAHFALMTMALKKLQREAGDYKEELT